MDTVQNGKGDKSRITDHERFRNGWDRIFGKGKNRDVTPPKCAVKPLKSSESVAVPETPPKANKQEWRKSKTVFKKYGL